MPFINLLNEVHNWRWELENFEIAKSSIFKKVQHRHASLIYKEIYINNEQIWKCILLLRYQYMEAIIFYKGKNLKLEWNSK